MELRHVLADFDNLPSHLVSKRERFTDNKIAGGSIVIIMQIGATNPTRSEPHKDLMLSGSWIRTFFDSEVFGSMDNAGNHD
jgi:hypothetical protein